MTHIPRQNEISFPKGVTQVNIPVMPPFKVGDFDTLVTPQASIDIDFCEGEHCLYAPHTTGRHYQEFSIITYFK